MKYKNIHTIRTVLKIQSEYCGNRQISIPLTRSYITSHSLWFSNLYKHANSSYITVNGIVLKGYLDISEVSKFFIIGGTSYIIVSSTLLCPIYYCVQYITVSNTLLCPIHYCVQYIIVSKYITVSNTLLCPAHYCVQYIIVSSTLLCPIHYCVQYIIVSNTLLCPIHYCVHIQYMCTVEAYG